METEIDGFILCEVLFPGKGERVDAKQGFVVSGTNVTFEFRDDPRAPRPPRLQDGQPLVKGVFVDHGFLPKATIADTTKAYERCQ